MDEEPSQVPRSLLPVSTGRRRQAWSAWSTSNLRALTIIMMMMVAERDPSGRNRASRARQSSSSTHDDDSKSSPFRVLGIALVADQLGKGARLVFRYPTTDGGSAASEDDLFFRLPARQMAKLFRPKPALCGQPMTLSVGGTVYCCCAVLMMDDETLDAEQQPGDAESAVDSDRLALFSVVVALAPYVQTSSIPITGWMAEKRDGGGTRRKEDDTSAMPPRLERASPSFLSVRRVHISLARVCRVLEREERRCRYVSLQAKLFHQIRHDTQKRWRELRKAGSAADNASVTSTAGNKTNAAASSSAATIAAAPGGNTTVSSTKAAGQGGGGGGAEHGGKRRHKKTNSFTLLSFEREAATNKDSGGNAAADDGQWQEEQEQEVLETIMAASPPTITTGSGAENDVEHHGNLARELIQVYHALARNDHDFPPSPAVLLSGRDDVVYINRHIAVAIEAVSPIRHSDALADGRKLVVRPYHTLLFPHAPPSQLLGSLSVASWSASPRRLQQILHMVNPQKSLLDISVDTNLPTEKVLDMATYLVGQGACVPSHVLTRQIRLACDHIDKIKEVSLSFSQTFGTNVNLFMLVSFLTISNRTLGEAMTLLTTSNDADVIWLRQSMEESLPESQKGFFQDTDVLVGAPSAEGYLDEAVSGVDELLYQMVVWLCSRTVLLQLQDYLVAKLSTSGGDHSSTIAEDDTDGSHAERKTDVNLRLDMASDDLLFKELLDADCLSGRTSVPACCWRTGLNPTKLSAFVARNDQIHVVTRVPAPGDDWGAA